MCVDWFTRTRQVLVGVSIACGDGPVILRQTTSRINEIQRFLGSESQSQTPGKTDKSLWNDMIMLCMHLSLALLHTGEWEMMKGLAALSPAEGDQGNQIFPVLPWANAMVAHCKGSLEEAIVLYHQALTEVVQKRKQAGDTDSQPHHSSNRFTRQHFSFICDRLCDCYVSLADWEGLHKWLRDLNRMRKASSFEGERKSGGSSFPDLGVLQQVGVSVSSDAIYYFKALAAFDMDDYESASLYLQEVSHSLSIPYSASRALLEIMILQGSKITREEGLRMLASVEKNLASEFSQLLWAGGDEIVPESTTCSVSGLLPCVSLLKEWNLERSDATPEFGRASESLLSKFLCDYPAPFGTSKYVRSTNYSLLLRVCRHLMRFSDGATERTHFERLYSSVAFQIGKQEAKQHNYASALRLISNPEVVRHFSKPLLALERGRVHKKGGDVSLALGLISDTIQSYCPVSFSNILFTSEDAKCFPSAVLNLFRDVAPSFEIVEEKISSHAPSSLIEFSDLFYKLGKWVRCLFGSDPNSWLWGTLASVGLKKLKEQNPIEKEEQRTVLGLWAEQSFDRALRLNPQNAKVWYTVGHWNNERVHHDGLTYVERLEKIDSPSSCLSTSPSSSSHLRASILSYASYLHLDHPTVHLRLACSLRLLSLLVNQEGLLLPGIQEQLNLVSIPPSVWVPIVPQIYSRLSHPHPDVRSYMVYLLHQAAIADPESVLYAAFRGSQIQSQEKAESILQAESKQLIDHLHKLNSTLVEESKMFFSELIRISELWEEQWYLLLQRLSGIVSHRLSVLKESLHSSSLSLEEKRTLYEAAMLPVIQKMEELIRSTALEAPQTPHELAFLGLHRQSLMKASLAFADPSSLPNPPNLKEREQQNQEGGRKNEDDSGGVGDDGWSRCWELCLALEKELKSAMRLKLKLTDVSPLLGSFSSQSLQVPALLADSLHTNPAGEPLARIKIHSISSSVLVLPTKTKPKKMVFLGTDGKRYTFLLKGREDLRLDQRITQFIRILNPFLTMKSARPARSYAVLPLNVRCGLIQWVDEAIPLFIIFKKWQRSEKMAQQFSVGSSAPPTKTPTSGLLDSFKWKLVNALKARGLSHLKSRKECPPEVLMEVFQQLVAETPSTLLSQELWLNSSSCRDWIQKVSVYSQSTAAMSMIGHVLGLGDRHLDNILMDFRTGEVVHIDYNVCFEKGMLLRVPETVPFRLTQNMERALDFRSVQGNFKDTSLKTLSVIRQHQTCLLGLLEAFVWDPLDDWVTELSEETERAKIDAFTHFLAVRVQVRDLGKIRDVLMSLQKSLCFLSDTLSAVVEDFQLEVKWKREQLEWEVKKEEIERVVKDLEQKRSDDAAACVRACSSCLDVVKEKKKIRNTLEQALKQCDLWQQGHAGFFSSLSDLVTPSSWAAATRPLPLVLQIVESLRNTDSPLLVAFHSEFIDHSSSLNSGLHHSYHQLSWQIEQALGVLHQYRSFVASICEPVSPGEVVGKEYVLENKCYEWSEAFSKLLEMDQAGPTIEQIEQIATAVTSSRSIDPSALSIFTPASRAHLHEFLSQLLGGREMTQEGGEIVGEGGATEEDKARMCELHDRVRGLHLSMKKNERFVELLGGSLGQLGSISQANDLASVDKAKNILLFLKGLVAPSSAGFFLLFDLFFSLYFSLSLALFLFFGFFHFLKF